MLVELIENYLIFINSGYTTKYINAVFVNDDDMIVSFILYKNNIKFHGFIGGSSYTVALSLKRILWYDRYAKLVDILNTDSLI